MRTYEIYFISGRMVEISQSEFTRLTIRFNTSNRNYARFICDSGAMLMIENIELIVPVGEPDAVEIKEPKAPEAKKELTDLEAERKAAMDDLMAKSSCTHTCEQELYKTDTKTGPRFFKLCSFCGGNRTRFIALKDLTDEELESAKEWGEKE